MVQSLQWQARSNNLARKEREKQTVDTNQRIRELADKFQLTQTKSGTWTFDLPPIRTGGPLPYMPSDQDVYETDSEGRVNYRETIEHLALPADKRGAVIALCEWYAHHAIDSNYELYCDDNEMRVGTKASMIKWLHEMWTIFA